jgi:sulfite oxidase
MQNANAKSFLCSFITVKDGYDRNHSTIPQINPLSHRLKITGLVEHELSLSIDDLRTKFEQHEVLACLQCAGNRRHTMRTRIKEVEGVDWFDGAVMNCLWKGPRLRDIILSAGIRSELRGEKGYKGNVACVCHEAPCQDAPEYGGSITLERAMLEEADCILALEVCLPMPPETQQKVP